MIYEEKWIDGHLHCRYGLPGKWEPFTRDQYRDKVIELRAELNWIREHSIPVDGVDFDRTPRNLKAPES